MTTRDNLTIDRFNEIEVTPAGHTYIGDAPGTIEAQAAFFKENGFLVFRGVMSPEFLCELDGELQRIADGFRELEPIREGFAMEDPSKWPSPDRPVFRKIGGIGDHSEAFSRLLRHPRIMEFLVPFYGPVIELYRDVVMMKQPRVGREKPWHQDAVYWEYEPNEFISAMTALDDARVENGALQVVPGSHQFGALEHHGKELQVELSQELQEKATYVPMAAGDVLMFHSLILHASEPNRSERPRRMCIFSYMAPHFRYTGDGDATPRMKIFESS
jgi:phytanoyl-CoA hydroxylase